MTQHTPSPNPPRRAARFLGVVLALLAGCAALGKETPFSEPVSTSGVGPFRRLSSDETRFRGAALSLGEVGLDGASWAAGSLFYAAGAVISPLPTRDVDLPARALDPGQFEPMRIFRSSVEEQFGFDTGSVVLDASQAWEGGFVTQPFAFEMEDGSIRLYYAGAGGIGLATAPNVGGTFSRAGDGLVLANDLGVQGGALRSPTVTVLDGIYYLYADDGTDIWVATSVDGLTFTLLDTDDAAAGTNPLRIPDPIDDDDPRELAHVSPAALVATSPTGRTTLRLYVECQQEPENGNEDQRVVAALASLDGVTFERARLPAQEARDAPGQPAIRPFHEGVSEALMYVTVARGTDPQLRALQVAVDPGRASFVPEEEATP
ncbi:MAG: hypothetical protein R3B40_03905 [Polyangiales bacterium]|nr:hypothetical protein [Sandaracinaceae bacterium]